jgi:hypothetical protein
MDEAQAMTHDQLDLKLEVKAGPEPGTFEGYGAVFGNRDRDGDIVQKGAFAESLKARTPALLWQHIGWVCGFALAWHFILYDLATWAQLAFLPDGPALPALNGTETLITVLLSMLGLGGLRTVEKIKGVARDNIAGGADK